MENLAQKIITPSTKDVFRIIFLYVGQGDATLLVVPNNGSYQYILIDTNIDKANGGIDVQKLLSDLLGENNLDIFINTHPHVDHILGIESIHKTTGIKEIWHSGHKPGKKYKDAYKEMETVIKDIGPENEYVLFGTNDSNKIRKSDKTTEIIKKIGDIDFQVLSPAEYVADEIEGEDPEKRYQRIHEQCAVIRFSFGNPGKCHIMITGDSDKTAWQDHITEYHNNHLSSNILSASHHGSRTFFKNSEDDEDVYEEHFNKIDPKFVIISSPKQKDSKHGHPHDDAIELYEKKVSKENLIHLGKNNECVLVDVTPDGRCDVRTNKDLSKEYGFNNDGDSSSMKNGIKSSVAIRTSRLDEKPMG